jgi:hypothetical protein
MQWEHAAKSYEFIESLERFLLDQQRNALPHDVEKLPKDEPQIGGPGSIYLFMRSTALSLTESGTYLCNDGC